MGLGEATTVADPQARSEDVRAREAARVAADAQAKLDQVRHEAGGAITGAEHRMREGVTAEERVDEPPLDWRLTPRNVILQLLALAIFGAIVWFLVSLVSDSLSVLFSAPAEPSE